MFNVLRTVPAPASLSKRQRYDEEDVLTALKTMFLDKCYLCESKDPHSINVEHFDAHQGVPAKKFDWNNLFYVCGRCNNIKLAKYANLLDCTDPSLNVVRAIKHLPPRTPGAKVEIQAMDTDPRTVTTAKLLNDIYNADEKRFNKKLTAVYLRIGIYRKVNRFLGHVNAYFDDETPPAEKADALQRMRTFMGPDQEYSAFLRWMALDDASLEGLLQNVIP